MCNEEPDGSSEGSVALDAALSGTLQIYTLSSTQSAPSASPRHSEESKPGQSGSDCELLAPHALPVRGISKEAILAR